MAEEKFDFSIDNLGPCTIQSPIKFSLNHGDFTANYVSDDSYVINNINIFDTTEPIKLDSSNLIQKAGPREKIYFEVALIGKMIEAREQRGLSQRELAKLCGVKQPAIARLESLKTTPQIDTLFKILAPLGYTLAIVPINNK